MTAKQRGEYRTDEGRERSEYNIGQRGSRQQICKQTAERYAGYRRRCKYRQGAERLIRRFLFESFIGFLSDRVSILYTVYFGDVSRVV